MKTKRCLTICLVLCLLLSGCSRFTGAGDGEYRIYYLNTDGNGLTEEFCDIKGDSTREKIEEVLKLMKEEPDSIDYKSVLIGEVNVKKWELTETKLDIYFNKSYHKLDKASRLLLRAAMVQTLVQIPGVDYVRFFAGDDPITNEEGEELGYLRAEDFVQNTGSSLHSYQEADLTLYFANQKGDKLTAEKESVRYNSNMSIEKLIVEQLMKGPSSADAKPTIPAGTKLLGVSVKDNVCYVNFDEGFLNIADNINPKLTIYSIVNSIIDGGETGQVQILVNGETNISYHETLDMSKPFTRNADIIEEEDD